MGECEDEEIRGNEWYQRIERLLSKQWLGFQADSPIPELIRKARAFDQLKGISRQLGIQEYLNNPGREPLFRDAFEELVFGLRFISSIKRVNSGQFGFVPVDCPDKATFVARTEKGNYKEEYLDAFWEGFKLAVEAVAQIRMQDHLLQPKDMLTLNCEFYAEQTERLAKVLGMEDVSLFDLVNAVEDLQRRHKLNLT
jgi:hypothetical protein